MQETQNLPLEIVARLAQIEASLTAIETMLLPIVELFAKMQEHPMLRSILG